MFHSSRAVWPQIVALAALLVVAVLALGANVEASLADRVTLLALGAVSVIAFWTPLSKYFVRDTAEARNASTFALMAAFFVLYSIARRSGPEEGWSLRTPLLPDDVFVISHAARIVVLCALLTIPFWFKNLSAPARATIIGLLTIVILGLSIFALLRRFYAVGATETLDPTPLIHSLMQIVEYAALSILCHVAVWHLDVRRWVLRALPILLLIIWARHQFAAPPVVVEEDE